MRGAQAIGGMAIVQSVIAKSANGGVLWTFSLGCLIVIARTRAANRAVGPGAGGLKWGRVLTVL